MVGCFGCGFKDNFEGGYQSGTGRLDSGCTSRDSCLLAVGQ
jgi:hypothetical protein